MKYTNTHINITITYIFSWKIYDIKLKCNLWHNSELISVTKVGIYCHHTAVDG
jgi:hypothetical protein